MKKGLASLLATATAGLLVLASAAPALALPTPSPELPADIAANDGGINFSYAIDPDGFANVGLNDSDFATAYEREQTTTFTATITNRYWQSIELIGAEQTDQLVSDLALTTFDDGATPQSLSLTETHTGTAGEITPIGVASLSIPNGDTQSLTFNAHYPQANVEYRDAEGTLAAYGYQAKVSLFFRGIATDGQGYVFTASVASNAHTPAFHNITKGETLECSKLPDGEQCASVSAYGFAGSSTTFPFAPLADPTDPPTGGVPTTLTCEITAVATSNGQLSITTRLDVQANDQGAGADYQFPTNTFADEGQVEIVSVELTDSTNNFSSEEEILELLPTFNWRTAPQTVEGATRTFTGQEATFTLADQTTSIADRDLVFRMNVTKFVSGEIGDVVPVICITALDAATPTPEQPQVPPMLPRTGSDDPTFYVVAGLALVLLGLAAMVVAYRREQARA